jgi:hypothetical protein
MLKSSLTKKEYEALPEPIREHYEEDGDSFMLAAEGLVAKSKLDEFRENNVEILRERDKLGAELEKVNKLGGAAELKRLRAEAAKAEKDKLQDEDKFDEWKTAWESEREAEREEYEAKIKLHKEELRKFKLTDKVRAAALEAGVNKEDVEDVLRLTASNFELGDNDDIKVYTFEGAPYGGEPKHFFEKYYRKAKPKFFEGSNSGGMGVDQISVNEPSVDSSGPVMEIKKSDHEAISTYLDDIASGKAVVVDG